MIPRLQAGETVAIGEVKASVVDTPEHGVLVVAFPADLQHLYRVRMARAGKPWLLIERMD